MANSRNKRKMEESACSGKPHDKKKRMVLIMKYKYVAYAIYECPASPTEYGKYIGKTPVLEQAVQACEKAKANGKSYFIKGIKADGAEVIFM